MAARQQAARAGNAARRARENPYIRRLVDDADLRRNVGEAAAAARSAYGRLSNGKRPARALMEDKKLKRDLEQAAESMRAVGDALRKSSRPRKRRLGRKLMLALAAAGLALALSEGLRKSVLDALFGAEEEFEYSSTTAPEPAPETVPA